MGKSRYRPDHYSGLVLFNMIFHTPWKSTGGNLGKEAYVSRYLYSYSYSSSSSQLDETPLSEYHLLHWSDIFTSRMSYLSMTDDYAFHDVL
jgi:hypothetical protein